ncbi:MAG: YlcI/YnfO family protein [Thermodesulfobacteriota bacterium]
MKTATIPSLRVEPEFREAVESVLHDGESLSGFVLKSLKESIRMRRLQKEFIARGLAARDEARQTGEYYEASDVLAELETMLSDAEDR